MDALLRWEPFHDDFGPLASWTGGFAPRLDMKETKDAYVLKADLPGVKEEEIDVSLSGNMLGLIRFRRRQMKGGYDGSDGRSEAASTT
jgi:HSP20 family protein